MTHYDVLGVSPAAGATELRQAYLARVRRHHPDAGGDPVEMTRLNHAWSVLSDPVRRRAYDLELGVRHVGDDAPSRPRTPFDADPFDLADSRPFHGAPRRGVLPFVPPALFLASIGTGSVGLVLDEPGIVGAAFGLFLLSCVAIAAVAMLTLRTNLRR